jgi:hypothetical protein
MFHHQNKQNKVIYITIHYIKSCAKENNSKCYTEHIQVHYKLTIDNSITIYKQKESHQLFLVLDLFPKDITSHHLDPWSWIRNTTLKLWVPTIKIAQTTLTLGMQIFNLTSKWKASKPLLNINTLCITWRSSWISWRQDQNVASCLLFSSTTNRNKLVHIIIAITMSVCITK